MVFDRKKLATKEKKELIQIEILYNRTRKYINAGIKIYAGQWKDTKMVNARHDVEEELAGKMRYNYSNVVSAFKGNESYLTQSFIHEFNLAVGDIFNESWLLGETDIMLKEQSEKEIELKPEINDTISVSGLMKVLDNVSESGRLSAIANEVIAGIWKKYLICLTRRKRKTSLLNILKLKKTKMLPDLPNVPIWM
ncbi:hypothetical protein EZS27_024475 [termite gut metagenome]|uniref:Arm DNA-binding domain-containing protein n=1 Tax=termite gut metagenome TaxID=433724 RepID=A0A5J4QZM9_9ZZZZ